MGNPNSSSISVAIGPVLRLINLVYFEYLAALYRMEKNLPESPVFLASKAEFKNS